MQGGWRAFWAWRPTGRQPRRTATPCRGHCDRTSGSASRWAWTCEAARRERAHRVGSGWAAARRAERSEEHTSELQSLMRISYADFCLKHKKLTHINHRNQLMIKNRTAPYNSVYL